MACVPLRCLFLKRNYLQPTSFSCLYLGFSMAGQSFSSVQCLYLLALLNHRRNPVQMHSMYSMVSSSSSQFLQRHVVAIPHPLRFTPDAQCPVTTMMAVWTDDFLAFSSFTVSISLLRGQSSF